MVKIDEEGMADLQEIMLIPRIKTVNVVDVILSDEYDIYMVLTDVDKPFLVNPMMWMHRQGKRIMDNFDILAFHTILLKEYTPQEYEENISEIAESLNIIYEFISNSVVSENKIKNTNMWIYGIKPSVSHFKENFKHLQKTIANIFIARLKDGNKEM